MAEETKKSRKIGDVFSDYKTNSNISDAEITKLNKQLKEKDTEIKKLQSPTYVNKLCAVERRLICKKIREEIDNEYPMLLPDSMKVVYKILENVEIK